MKGMGKSGVPWADYRWNPVEGCSEKSEGCLNCYAKTMARRFRRPWGRPVNRTAAWYEPHDTRKPGRVFVCSTSDLFHEAIPHLTILMLIERMAQVPRHTFMVLTKRPENMPRIVWPENVWLGVTAENQARYDERWRILRGHRATVRFVSVEPMLGPVSMLYQDTAELPDWVICGPETGVGRRSCDPDWIWELMMECEKEWIPFFDKRDLKHVRRQWPDARRQVSTRSGDNLQAEVRQ